MKANYLQHLREAHTHRDCENERDRGRMGRGGGGGRDKKTDLSHLASATKSGKNMCIQLLKEVNQYE